MPIQHLFLYRTSVILTVLFLCNMWTGYGILFLVPDMMSHGYCSMSEWFDVIYITENGCINYTRVRIFFFFFVFFFFFFLNRQPTQTPLSLLWGTRIAKGGADPNPPRWTWRHPLLCLSVSELDAFTPPGLLRGDATVSTPTLDAQHECTSSSVLGGIRSQPLSVL